MRPCGNCGSAHSRPPSPADGHCARRCGGGGPPSSSQSGLPKDPRALQGPTAHRAPPSWSSSPPPVPLTSAALPRRLGRKTPPGVWPLVARLVLPADTCRDPAPRCAWPGRGAPSLSRALVSAGRAGRGVLGRFACLWLPHPPCPAPEFLCGFQTQRLSARAALDSVPKVPRQGGGGDPEDPRALAPVGSQGRSAPAAPWGNLSSCQGPLALNRLILPQTAIVLGAYLVTSSGLSVLYSRTGSCS